MTSSLETRDGGLWLFQKTGTQLASLGADLSSNGGIWIQNKPGNLVLSAGSSGTEEGMWVYDGQGWPRLSATVATPQQDAAFNVLDQDGNVLWSTGEVNTAAKATTWGQIKAEL